MNDLKKVRGSLTVKGYALFTSDVLYKKYLDYINCEVIILVLLKSDGSRILFNAVVQPSVYISNSLGSHPRDLINTASRRSKFQYWF